MELEKDVGKMEWVEDVEKGIRGRECGEKDERWEEGEGGLWSG